MSVIGLDIGTTRIKAVLHDIERDSLPIAAVLTPVIASPHGDLRAAEDVVRAAVDCITELLAGLPPAERARIEGIGVASLSEEIVLINDRGRSVAAMPTWYTAVMQAESERFGLNPSFSWSKLRWASEYLDADAAAAVRGLTSLGSYVSARLARGATAAIDYSHASRTGFFSIEKSRWDVALFETTGWPGELLPPLVSSGTMLGSVDPSLRERWGMEAAATVAVAGHDHFCAAFAAGVREPGQLFLSSGTSEAHVLLIDDATDLVLPPHVQLGRYVDGRSFYLHAHLPSGHLYSHLEKLAGGRERLAEIEAQALDEPVGASGIEFMPRVGADPGYSVRGLSARADAGSFIRAVQEGLAAASRNLDSELESLSGTTASSLVATGVATSNALWTQIRGALSLAPLRVVEEAELTALGAAHIFRWGDTGEVSPPVPHHSVENDPRVTAEYERLLAGQ